MTIRSLPVCGILLATASWLPAQQSKLTGPVSGFVFDSPARVLRPIQGVPGASLLGDGVDFGFALQSAYVSPRQDAALVVGSDQSLHLYRIGGGSISEISLGGISGVPQEVVFSPSGKSAALFAMGRARILTGLPDAPTLSATVNVPNSSTATSRVSVGGRPQPGRAPGQTLALSDDGAYLLTVAGGSVRLLSTHGENRSLMTAGNDALVAFAADGHDAAVMDSASGLTLIHDAAGAAGMETLSQPDEGLAAAAGLAFSQDKQTLYVASATARSVASFSLSAHSRSTVDCACSPAALIPMGNLFRLNDIDGAPLWLLEGAAGKPRTVFVPARGE